MSVERPNPPERSDYLKAYDALPEPFERGSISALDKPVLRILDELKDSILQGEYAAIIGEDASGRLPTLMLGHVILDVYKAQKNQPPLLRFFAGSRKLSKNSYKDQILKHNALESQIGKLKQSIEKSGSKGSKILVITDTILTGRSLDPLMAAIRENGLKVDIVTIGLADEEALQGSRNLESRWGAKIVLGEIGTPEIYAFGRSLSGLK